MLIPNLMPLLPPTVVVTETGYLQGLEYVLSAPLTDKVHRPLALKNRLLLPPIILWVMGPNWADFLFLCHELG